MTKAKAEILHIRDETDSVGSRSAVCTVMHFLLGKELFLRPLLIFRVCRAPSFGPLNERHVWCDLCCGVQEAVFVAIYKDGVAAEAPQVRHNTTTRGFFGGACVEQRLELFFYFFYF